MTLSKLTRAFAAFIPLALAAVSAPVAQAAPADERGSYDDSYPYTALLCGRSWNVAAHDWGQFQVRSSAQGAPEAFVHEVHNYTRTYVAENGDSFLRSGKENMRITDVQRVLGNLWRIEVVTTGRTWTMSSVSGRLIWADRGLFRSHVLIDTLGDDDPENDVYDASYSWSGPHFLSDTLPGSQYCDYVDQAIAAG